MWHQYYYHVWSFRMVERRNKSNKWMNNIMSAYKCILLFSIWLNLLRLLINTVLTYGVYWYNTFSNHFIYSMSYIWPLKYFLFIETKMEYVYLPCHTRSDIASIVVLADISSFSILRFRLPFVSTTWYNA